MAYTNNLHVVYGEASLGVNGQDFAYLFSYERGGLESLKIKDKRMALPHAYTNFLAGDHR